MILAHPGMSIRRLARVLIPLLMVSGCASGMSAIDAQTRELLNRGSASLGADAGPQRIGPDKYQLRRDGISSTRVRSINPLAGEIAFDQASEDRDVAQRLSEFTDEALSRESTDRLAIGLVEALAIAQRSSRDYRSAEEDYILGAIRLLIERHLWSPRFFNDTSFNLDGNGKDGTFDTALDIINTLRVTKRLPFGGDVEARWIWQAAQDLRTRASERYTQSSRIVLSGNIPLLRGAGRVARESLIQAERDLVYDARDFERFRREFLVQIANGYFALLQQQARIASQQEQIESQKQDFERTSQLVDAGELRPFQRAISENGLRIAESGLASQNQQYILQIERFMVLLGLDPQTPVDILPLDLDLPEPEISQGEAAKRALAYRLDLQNRRDRLDDSRRDVLNARDRLLPDLNLDASVTIPTDSNLDIGGVGFDGGDVDFSVGAMFSLPLDRQTEALNLRQSMIGLERAIRDYERFRDGIIIDSRSSLRGIELARFRLQLAERQVEIANKRLQEQQLDPAGVTAQEFLDTTNDLLDAKNSRDDAISDLRSAILQYLLDTGQLRVGAEGQLTALSGMGDENIGTSGTEPGDGDGQTPAVGSGS